MPTRIIKLMWSDDPQNEGYKVNWSDNPYLWSEVQVVIELAGLLSGGMNTVVGVNNWLNQDVKKKKTLITLICKIEGKDYKESKEIKKVKVTSKQIKLVIEEVTKKTIKVII